MISFDKKFCVNVASHHNLHIAKNMVYGGQLGESSKSQVWNLTNEKDLGVGEEVVGEKKFSPTSHVFSTFILN